MSRSLYAIQSELDDIIRGLEGDPDNPSLFTPEEAQSAIDSWLDDNRNEVASKLDDYCAVIADKTAMAEARKKEAQALSRMAAGDERVATLLKERALAFFERAGIERMETLHFKPRIQANGGKPPVILSEDVRENPRLLPEAFQRVTVEPDVDVIRAALDYGANLPFAQMGERGKHFRVR